MNSLLTKAIRGTYMQCCGSGTFWSEPVQRSGSTIDKKQTKFSMKFSSLVPTLIKGYLKKTNTYKWYFSSEEEGTLFKKILMVESLLFYRSWSRRRWKKYPEPVKNGSARNTGYRICTKDLMWGPQQNFELLLTKEQITSVFSHLFFSSSSQLYNNWFFYCLPGNPNGLLPLKRSN